MKFWDDNLRLCPKCKASVEWSADLRTECPRCHAQVWFFNYRPLPEPPDLPAPQPPNLWANPTTLLLLGSTALFGVVALVGVLNHLVVAVVCALAAIGFAAFGFLRHAETRRLEEGLQHTNAVVQYAQTLRNRVQQLTNRYNHLLNTGNARIEHYYGEIYTRAEQQRTEAATLRVQAMLDREAVRTVEDRIYAVAERLVQDHQKWASTKLRADPENYQRRKLELEKTFVFVQKVGYRLPADVKRNSLAKLKQDYAAVVREQNLKDEQRRIKQQAREEEQIRREREQALREAETKEHDIQQRLEEALRRHHDAHSAEVEQLRQQLAEAQAGSQRAKSMAELTKAGHVYILSNIGSFGEDVYKVGMTRRLDPQDRVKELSDASVPFPFDVHAMISCNDAPALENALHRALTRHRVNRINLRKEFFRIELDTILHLVRSHHGQVDYVAEPEALEYRETQSITPDEVVEFETELAEMGVAIDGSEEE